MVPKTFKSNKGNFQTLLVINFYLAAVILGISSLQPANLNP